MASGFFNRRSLWPGHVAKDAVSTQEIPDAAQKEVSNRSVKRGDDEREVRYPHSSGESE